jgi:hypothetical protein
MCQKLANVLPFLEVSAMILVKEDHGLLPKES